ncbi:hypothetical protein F4821DRAFT_98282 [Hypoxylon rubiginosum]|uniref:Uncharacterized protein n=1 Tax=Hypoxylon rubiginosum TaxID=110542 RepID=A0ACC0D5F7_9PEZI|nr:hypothetical protein F4821DRAFT_98282 [Hypoxylon rubiginosum]
MATQAMSDLSLSSAAKAKNLKSLKAAQQVADSWEDEDIESDTEDAITTTTTQPLSPSLTSDSPKIDGSGFAAPPPTPSSPSYSAGAQPPWQPLSSATTSPPASPSGRLGLGDEERRRPEKTDAVARRMIASALGVRAPRATEEQRAYDRAVREKERKRREEEREAERKRKEEAERAKAAIWDD